MEIFTNLSRKMCRTHKHTCNINASFPQFSLLEGVGCKINFSITDFIKRCWEELNFFVIFDNFLVKFLQGYRGAGGEISWYMHQKILVCAMPKYCNLCSAPSIWIPNDYFTSLPKCSRPANHIALFDTNCCQGAALQRIHEGQSTIHSAVYKGWSAICSAGLHHVGIHMRKPQNLRIICSSWIRSILTHTEMSRSKNCG